MSDPQVPGSWRAEFTPPRVVGAVITGVVATVVWTLGGVMWGHRRTVAQYIWPIGVTIFLLVVCIVLAIELISVKLRLPERSDPPDGRAAGGAVAQVGAPSQHDGPATTSGLEVVGRDRDMRRLERAATGHPGTFLTIVGTGGVGKTTLVKEWARGQPARKVHFVAASKATNTEGLALAVATELSIRIVDGGRLPVDAVAEALRLRTEPTVLVLDNLEQIGDSAGGVVAKWARCNELVSIIVTSRRELRVANERVLALSSLPLSAKGVTAADELRAPSDAVRLFAELAKARDSDFELTSKNVLVVHQICDALEGLPLGIELAAWLTPSRSVQEVLAAVRTPSNTLGPGPADADERHHSLDAMIQGSLELVNDDLRAAMFQLSWSTSFSVDDAQAIVRLPSGLMLGRDQLEELHHASLLELERSRDQTRFRQRAEIRRWCRFRCETVADCLQARDRCRAYYLSAAERALGERFGDVAPALDTLEASYWNLLEFMTDAKASGDAETAARIGICLAWFVAIRRPGEPREATLNDLKDALPGTALELRLRTLLELALTRLERAAMVDHELTSSAAEAVADCEELTPFVDSHELKGRVFLARAGLEALNRNSTGTEEACLAASEEFARAGLIAAEALALIQAGLTPPLTEHEAWLDKAETLLSGTTAAGVKTLLGVAKARTFLERQMPQDAISKLAGLDEVVDQIDNPLQRATVLELRAIAQTDLGDHRRAHDEFERLAEFYKEAGLRSAYALTLANQAACLLRPECPTNEDLDRSISLLNEVVRIGGLDAIFLARIHGNLALAHLRRNRLQLAAEHDQKAAAAREPEVVDRDPINGFIIWSVHAEVLAAIQEPAAAEAARRALQIAAENALESHPQVHYHRPRLEQIYPDPAEARHNTNRG